MSYLWHEKRVGLRDTREVRLRNPLSSSLFISLINILTSQPPNVWSPCNTLEYSLALGTRHILISPSVGPWWMIVNYWFLLPIILVTYLSSSVDRGSIFTRILLSIGRESDVRNPRGRETSDGKIKVQMISEDTREIYRCNDGWTGNLVSSSLATLII